MNSDLNDNHSDSTDDDDGICEDGLKVCECNAPVAEWDSGLFEPEEEYHLPRSSPVISRKRHNTEKQSGLSLTPPIWELSSSPTVKSNYSSPHRLVGPVAQRKRETLIAVIHPRALQDRRSSSQIIMAQEFHLSLRTLAASLLFLDGYMRVSSQRLKEEPALTSHQHLVRGAQTKLRNMDHV